MGSIDLSLSARRNIWGASFHYNQYKIHRIGHVQFIHTYMSPVCLGESLHAPDKVFIKTLNLEYSNVNQSLLPSHC